MGFMFVEHLNEIESKRIRLDSVLDAIPLTLFVHFQSRYEKTGSRETSGWRMCISSECQQRWSARPNSIGKTWIILLKAYLLILTSYCLYSQQAARIGWHIEHVFKRILFAESFFFVKITLFRKPAFCESTSVC